MFSLFLGRRQNGTKRHPARSRQASQTRPAVESLEDRTVPSSLFIGDAKDNTVKQFDATTGEFQGTFVDSESGGLHGPRGVVFDHSGNLLVSNQNVNLPIAGDVLRYNGATGAFKNQVISPSDPHAPFAPRGIVLTSDDTLWVADIVAPDNLSDGKIEEYHYNESTGTATFKAEIDHPAAFSGQFHPRGLVIGPDGMLYVATRNIPEPTGGAILRFNPMSGAFLGAFVTSDSTNDLQRPEGLVFGPDGNLYSTSFQASTSDTDKIDIFAGPSAATPGAFLGQIDLDQVGGDRAFAQALLFGPNGKLFVPITGGDQSTTGTVRRYDVTTKAFDIFITSAHLGQPWYLTFRQTDPATLAFGTPDDSASGVVAADGMVPVATPPLPASSQGQPVNPSAPGSSAGSGQPVQPSLPLLLMSMLPVARSEWDSLASSLAQDRPAARMDQADGLFAAEGSNWASDLFGAEGLLA